MNRKRYKLRFFYILKEKEIIPIDDVDEWKKWYENSKERFIKRDKINKKLISTIFLGLDHNCGWEKDKRPLLFETMIFHDHDLREEYCERYHTYDEALNGHERILEKVKKGEEL